MTPKTVREPRGKLQAVRELRLLRENAPPEERRPRVRADCENGLRPCPFAGCRHHLFLDATAGTPSFKVNWPSAEDEDDPDFSSLPETCSLDVADRGEHTLEQVGDLLNVSREAVRLVEAKALRNLGRTVRVSYAAPSLAEPWEHAHDTALPPGGEEF